jgi:hypothetical protein
MTQHEPDYQYDSDHADNIITVILYRSDLESERNLGLALDNDTWEDLKHGMERDCSLLEPAVLILHDEYGIGDGNLRKPDALTAPKRITNAKIVLVAAQVKLIVQPIHDAGHTELAEQVTEKAVEMLTLSAGAPGDPDAQAGRERIRELIPRFR